MIAALVDSPGGRIVGLFLLGAASGQVLQAIAHALRWQPRELPHARPSQRPALAARPWYYWLPIVGVLCAPSRPGERASVWVRPLVVQLLTGLLWAGLYIHEVEHLGLLPLGLRDQASVALHAQARSIYLVHLVLSSLLIVASLTDIDDKLIPDQVTIPGTLVCLALMTLLPGARLPEPTAGHEAVRSLTFASPNEFPLGFAGSPQLAGLLAGGGAFLAWCLALLPRVWRVRRGWRMAWRIFLAHLRVPLSLWVVAIAAVGLPAIAGVWSHGGEVWESLLTALLGLLGGGAIVWITRQVGFFAMGREVMGFGDVTLLALIGTVIGWQAAVLAFFLAPFFAMGHAVGQWLAGRGGEVWYGPYLCLATGFVIVFWPSAWSQIADYFALAWLVPLGLVLCFGLMSLLLGLMRWVRG